MAWSSATRAGAWFAQKVAWKLDPLLLGRSHGRMSSAGILPTLLLEARGARSGRPRRTAVLYFHDAASVIIVASKAGAPHHPAWYHNLVAHPDVLVNDAPYVATEVSDPAERERLWPLADNVFPPFRQYREAAARAQRTIPLVRLTPR